MITAAADGSSLSNPGPAGWAWYVDEDCWAAGGWVHGTNNMGELRAVLEILRATRGVADQLTLLCDSQYAINVCSKWIPGWKRRGWKKADGKPILNLDLIQELDVELAGREVAFEWVKGHSGHSLNERADEKARAAATAFRDGTTFDAGPGFGGGTGVDAASEPARLPAPASTGTRPARVEPHDALFELDPAALSDAEQVVLAERELLSDRVRSDRGAVDALLHPDFVEFGASGRTWSRAAMLGSIGPLADVPDVESVRVDQLSADVILHVWRSRRPDAVVNRSSLWQRTPSGWQLRFHQGTTAFGPDAR